MKNTLFRMVTVLLVMLTLAVNVVSAQSSVRVPRPDGQQAFVPPSSAMPSFQQQFEAKRAQQLQDWKAKMDTASGGVLNLAIRAPANDNLANATAISVPFTGTVSAIETATTEAGKLAFCRGNNTDVWFKLTVASATTVDIVTSGSNYDTVLVLFSASGTPTSEADLSFVNCNDDSYVGSGLYGVALEAGTYYIRVSDYGTTPPSAGSELILDVSLSENPLPFYYQTPYPDTYAIAPAQYIWSPSERATSYDFTMYDVTGTATTVFNLTGLTPAADSDGLECDTDDQCILTLSGTNQALITDLKDFEWMVTATNSAGTNQGVDYDIDNLFSTDFGELPTSIYIYNVYPEVQISDPTVYEWTTSPDATSYDFVVNQTLPSPDAGVIQLVDLTPEDDSDGLNCDFYYCRLTMNPATRAALTDGSTYEYSSTANNTNGGTSSNTATFSIDATPAPQPFYHSVNKLVYYTQNFSFYWYWSFYAETYNFHLERTSPSAAVVVDETGLTPEADEDGLFCYYQSYCYYVLENSSTALTNGEYAYSVSAVNANGSIDADNSPEDFTVNTDIAFNVLSPAANSSFDSASEITSFTWEQISAANTTLADNWTFYIGANYAPGRSFSLGYLTESADADPLTCTGGTCTFAVSGTRLGLSRNQYYWYASNSVNYSGVVPRSATIYASTSNFAIGEVPSNFYVKNGSFEFYNTSKIPTDWKVNGTLAGKVKCNKPEKTLAFSGNCTWFTKGVTTNGSIVQILDPTGMVAGDGVTLYGYMWGKNTTSASIQLKIKLADDSKAKLTLSAASSTEYVYYEDEASLGASPVKGKLKISNRSNGGKLYVDNLYADPILSGSAILAALPLPLPAVPQSGLGGRQNVPQSQNGLTGR